MTRFLNPSWQALLTLGALKWQNLLAGPWGTRNASKDRKSAAAPGVCYFLIKWVLLPNSYRVFFEILFKIFKPKKSK